MCRRGLLFVVLDSTNVHAQNDSIKRSDSIQSHGVYKATNLSDREILLDTEDLRTLAREVDSLEESYKQFASDEYTRGHADGYAGNQPETADITYVYHVHTGNSSTGDGCYTSPVYHSHSGDCYTRVRCRGSFASRSYAGTKNFGNGDEPVYNYEDCSECGTSLHEHTNSSHYRSVLDCSKGSQIIGYALGCGKSPSTIESITITYY